MTVTGLVFDAMTGQPIPAATIAVIGSDGQMTGEGTVADVNGNFSLSVGSPNDSQLQISSIGYQTNVLDPYGVEENGQVSLFPSTTQLPGVTITAKAPNNSGSYNANQMNNLNNAPSVSTVFSTLKGPLITAGVIILLSYLFVEHNDKKKRRR